MVLEPTGSALSMYLSMIARSTDLLRSSRTGEFIKLYLEIFLINVTDLRYQSENSMSISTRTWID
jgi:hypothetical protein